MRLSVFAVNFVDSMQPYQSVIIQSIRDEAPGAKTFALTYADGSGIPYVAGQFITIVFTHHGREERRSFSISSSPVDDGGVLSLTVKRIDNGAYSRLLTDKAKVGDTLLTTGAAGLFTLPANIDAYKQLFFFAAGIGITPILSLIKTVLHTQPGVQVVLVYSNRSIGDMVFYTDLQLLLQRYPDKFKIEFLYSTSFNLVRARLNKSLLPVLLKEYGVVPREQMLFFLCGPFDYMRMVIYALEEQGIDESQIKRENFNTNNRQVVKAEPPDKDRHVVTIRLNGNEYALPVQYPETILQAARKQGINLPYSCEVGRCGSCAARCTQGKVWLSYNEVLMDLDLKHGAILTCTGHPIGGDVVIDA